MKKETFDAVVKWQKETFPLATPLSKIEHLLQEIQELKEDIINNNPKKRLEYADCFLLLFGAAHADGFEYNDIDDFSIEKLEINRARKWGKPDSNGVVNHIKV